MSSFPALVRCFFYKWRDAKSGLSASNKRSANHRQRSASSFNGNCEAINKINTVKAEAKKLLRTVRKMIILMTIKVKKLSDKKRRKWMGGDWQMVGYSGSAYGTPKQSRWRVIKQSTAGLSITFHLIRLLVTESYFFSLSKSQKIALKIYTRIELRKLVKKYKLSIIHWQNILVLWVGAFFLFFLLLSFSQVFRLTFRH